MENIRVKLTIRLNQNHALTEKELNGFKPAIQRAVAGCLPQSVFVDTIEVTKIKEVPSPDPTSKMKANRTERLVELSREAFAWPRTAVLPSAAALNTDQWQYSEGLLSFLGYSVGQKGAYRNERQHILDYVYNERLPRVDSAEYMAHWGEPKTARRLRKLAESLASFARMARRKNSADMGLAISEWEEDLAVLKTKYYDGRYDSLFLWPHPQSSKSVFA